MKALQAYVDRKNQWSNLFGSKPLEIGKDNQKIADSLDCDLSPENLTCDGELSRAQVNAKFKQLTQAARELQALDPSVKFYEFA
jgi:hypothetical protein